MRYNSNSNTASASNSTRPSLHRRAKQHIYNKNPDLIEYDYSVVPLYMIAEYESMSVDGTLQSNPPGGLPLTSYFASIPHEPSTLCQLFGVGVVFLHPRTGTVYLFNAMRQAFCNRNGQAFTNVQQEELGNQRDFGRLAPPPQRFRYPWPPSAGQLPSTFFELGSYYVDPPAIMNSSFIGMMPGMESGFGMGSFGSPFLAQQRNNTMLQANFPTITQANLSQLML